MTEREGWYILRTSGGHRILWIARWNGYANMDNIILTSTKIGKEV